MSSHIIYTLLVAMLLTACSGQDDIPVTEPDPRPIVFGYKYNVDLFTTEQSRDGSTSGTAVNSSADPIPPTTAGVFGAMKEYDHAVFDDQKFYHIGDQPYLDDYNTLKASWDVTGYDWSQIDNDWPYAPIVSWTLGKDYNFYCYTPHSSYDNTKAEMAYVKYGGMQKFTHSKIPPFSNVAYTVSKAVVDTFSCSVVPFKMKHLSARICLCMKIGEKYARLREIRVKEVTINDRGTDADYYKWEVDLTQKDPIYTLSTDGKYAPASASSVVNIIPIFKDAAGLKLDDKKYQQFGSLYVMPQNVGTLRMNVKYDVYDKSGMLVRQDQTISNDVEFFKDVEAGYYYNINIVVSPAYLYVLSDNDAELGEHGVVLLDVIP